MTTYSLENHLARLGHVATSGSPPKWCHEKVRVLCHQNPPPKNKFRFRNYTNFAQMVGWLKCVVFVCDVCLFVCLFDCYVCLFVCLFAMFVCDVCLFACLFVCLFVLTLHVVWTFSFPYQNPTKWKFPSPGGLPRAFSLNKTTNKVEMIFMICLAFMF